MLNRKKAMEQETMWTCCDEEVYDHDGIIQHLKAVHGLRSPILMNQRAALHLDGEDFSLNSYEVTIGELVLHKTVKTWWEEAPA